MTSLQKTSGFPVEVLPEELGGKLPSGDELAKVGRIKKLKKKSKSPGCVSDVRVIRTIETMHDLVCRCSKNITHASGIYFTRPYT